MTVDKKSNVIHSIDQEASSSSVAVCVSRSRENVCSLVSIRLVVRKLFMVHKTNSNDNNTNRRSCLLLRRTRKDQMLYTGDTQKHTKTNEKTTTKKKTQLGSEHEKRKRLIVGIGIARNVLASNEIEYYFSNDFYLFVSCVCSFIYYELLNA